MVVQARQHKAAGWMLRQRRAGPLTSSVMLPVKLANIMKHLISNEDQEFKNQVESCEYPMPEFDHRAHLRLAYVYLVENRTEGAVQLMRDTLTGLLKHTGIDPSEKYHETLTEAWILAVHHFMNNTDYSKSADDFIAQNSVMLDSEIMLTHYSAEVLFSEQARKKFVEPNLDPIPRHGE